MVSEYLFNTDTAQCLPDMDHPIKLPNLFWDGNLPYTLMLHGISFLHKERSQMLTSLQMTCAADSSVLLSLPSFVGLKVPLFVLAAVGKVLLTLKGKSGFYPDLPSHGRGQSMSQTGILDGSLRATSTGFPYVEAVSSLLICVFPAVFLWRYESLESLSSK